MADRPVRDGEKILIENIIDACGLAAVIAAVSDICGEKAEHIQANWQDASTAQWWTARAEAVDKLLAKPFMQDV